MSVIVENLTKKFGHQKAVDQINFKVEKGAILGFLGPNGAGKSTTMKMITCFIPPTEGTIQVCGFDTSQHPLEVRRKIGYLPEHNPLYKDMYVKEYLSFVGGLHKINHLKQRVGEMIEMTGLEREQKKLIGALSKGYRQRAGLAQAMLHDPEVLILDEPTSGLDPNQLVEIRSLIKALGKEKTVIFSSHVMQEVQALCNRVVIINQGKIVANDHIERLQDHLKGKVTVHFEFKEMVHIDQIKTIPGVQNISQIRENEWQVTAISEADVRQSIFKFAVDNNLTLLELYKEKYSVEDVFQKLTL